ncbi:hypothetical protein NE237_015575 [Protea cynaroides]|uniref:Uncharacterized protein n=1 Tax=Protea cynaroides TaxID=273540 RepID=A0A9Q0KEH7_9MAGN|nr:hypothetical protein NE237_015575 [Protea cynaroides]
MGNPSIEAAIELEKKRANRKLRELDRGRSNNPVFGLFNRVARDNLSKEKERLERAKETFKALDLNKWVQSGFDRECKDLIRKRHLFASRGSCIWFCMLRQRESLTATEELMPSLVIFAVGLDGPVGLVMDLFCAREDQLGRQPTMDLAITKVAPTVKVV